MRVTVFGLEIFVAGKRSRFKRIGFVSLLVVVDGEAFDEINNRLVIDGAEQGNDILITPFAKIKSNSIFAILYDEFTFFRIIFLFD